MEPEILYCPDFLWIYSHGKSWIKAKKLGLDCPPMVLKDSNRLFHSNYVLISLSREYASISLVPHCWTFNV